MDIKNTRLRFVSSPSPEGLEAVLNSLPFKVEIKNVVYSDKLWFCWFVLPDTVSHESFETHANETDAKIEFSSIRAEEFL